MINALCLSDLRFSLVSVQAGTGAHYSYGSQYDVKCIVSLFTRGSERAKVRDAEEIKVYVLYAFMSCIVFIFLVKLLVQLVD